MKNEKHKLIRPTLNEFKKSLEKENDSKKVESIIKEIKLNNMEFVINLEHVISTPELFDFLVETFNLSDEELTKALNLPFCLIRSICMKALDYYVPENQPLIL